MKILCVGTGESTEWFFNQKDLKIPSDVKLLAFHRSFPFIKQTFDYWVWQDPEASLDGISFFLKHKKNKTLPHVVLPFWMESINLHKKYAGTSRIHRDPNQCNLYESGISFLKNNNNITLIKNSISTKSININDEVFSNPNLRFNNKNVFFGTVPCDGITSECNWAQENKFTFYVLPICHYLGASEVYWIGFDNQGSGFQAKLKNYHTKKVTQFHNNKSLMSSSEKKYIPWVKDWAPIHNMKIISLAPNKLTQLNKIMDHKNIENLKWTK